MGITSPIKLFPALLAPALFLALYAIAPAAAKTADGEWVGSVSSEEGDCLLGGDDPHMRIVNGRFEAVIPQGSESQTFRGEISSHGNFDVWGEWKVLEQSMPTRARFQGRTIGTNLKVKLTAIPGNVNSYCVMAISFLPKKTDKKSMRAAAAKNTDDKVCLDALVAGGITNGQPTTFSWSQFSKGAVRKAKARGFSPKGCWKHLRLADKRKIDAQARQAAAKPTQSAQKKPSGNQNSNVRNVATAGNAGAFQGRWVGREISCGWGAGSFEVGYEATVSVSGTDLRLDILRHPSTNGEAKTFARKFPKNGRLRMTPFSDVEMTFKFDAPSGTVVANTDDCSFALAREGGPGPGTTAVAAAENPRRGQTGTAQARQPESASASTRQLVSLRDTDAFQGKWVGEAISCGFSTGGYDLNYETVILVRGSNMNLEIVSSNKLGRERTEHEKKFPQNGSLQVTARSDVQMSFKFDPANGSVVASTDACSFALAREGGPGPGTTAVAAAESPRREQAKAAPDSTRKFVAFNDSDAFEGRWKGFVGACGWSGGGYEISYDMTVSVAGQRMDMEIQRSISYDTAHRKYSRTIPSGGFLRFAVFDNVPVTFSFDNDTGAVTAKMDDCTIALKRDGGPREPRVRTAANERKRKRVVQDRRVKDRPAARATAKQRYAAARQLDPPGPNKAQKLKRARLAAAAKRRQQAELQRRKAAEQARIKLETAKLEGQRLQKGLGAEERRQIQHGLAELGFHKGTVDGILGSGTRRAVAAYQKSIQALETGYLTMAQTTHVIETGMDAIAAKQKRLEEDARLAAEAAHERKLKAARLAAKAEKERKLAAARAEKARKLAEAKAAKERKVAEAKAKKARKLAEAKAEKERMVAATKAAQERKVAAAKAAKDKRSQAKQTALRALRLKHKYAVAVIVGNRDYGGRTPDVAFARNDADAVRRFVIDKLGYRKGNIIDLRDATLTQLNATFGTAGNHRGRLFDYVRAGKSDVVVFYSGHGVPGLRDRKGYLLPVDADPNRVELNGYPLDTLLGNLGKIPARSMSVYLDACFSGESEKGMLVRATSGLTVKAVMPESSKGMVVVTAARNDQFASWDEDAKQGLFTKHLLEALSGTADGEGFGNGDGRVTLAELHAYLDDEMTYQARRRWSRDQNASIQGNPDSVLVTLQ
ncbi:MAG: hypothetical protein HOC72_13525 [Rhodospirillaceae bacterium]|nr:hypothetical protein [Rhodospirillaceae bacterium]